MATSNPLLPSPTAVSTGILELAAADRPRGAAEGLDLLKSLGISRGASDPTSDQFPTVVAEVTGEWSATNSGLVLAADGEVEHFWSHLWIASEGLRVGFDTLVESINAVVGPADEDLETNCSRSAWWSRHPAEIELYLYGERPPAPAAAQIGITWTDGAAGPARAT
jgi:hypothetical protein